MDRQQLQQRLMGTFLAELEEHVAALNRNLLIADKRPEASRAELVEGLFRTVHSLKGASRSANVHAIEAACHRLESTLAGVRDGRSPLNGELIQLLFTATDALKDAGDRLRARQPLVDAPIQTLVSQLEAAARRADETPLPAPPPSAAPAPGASLGGASRSAPMAPSAEFVRVSRQKLDAVLARSSELLTARHRAVDGLQEVASLRHALQRCRSEWRMIERPLEKLLGSPSPALSRRAIEVLERQGETLRRLERTAELAFSRLAADHRGLEQAASALDEQLLGVRLVPFGDVCTELERAIRDLARAASKPVELVVEGTEIEIGRSVLDSLRDPLLHLLRNAVDHGVETPDERRAAGKPIPARVTLTVSLRGNTIDIVVADDGRGVDLAAVREQARQRQLAVPADDRDAMRLLFLPGFSTAPLVTELSGRGVGLDVVKHHVESLHGHVGLTSTPGQGTRVTVTVPLLVASMRLLLLTAAGQTFALPLTSIVRLTRVNPEELGTAAGRDVLLGEGAPVPVTTLAGVLGIREEAPWRGGKRPIVIVTSGTRQAAFIVDDVQAEHELVIKSLAPRLRIRLFAGATVLPTGRVALVLNAADLVERALALPSRPAFAAGRGRPAIEGRRRLLLAEDSITTRSLEKSLLEAAGYEVTAAVDGGEAWRLLQERGADLVVADVEMPHMDGFALCEAIRESRRFRDLPVVLVTARERDGDKARGLQVGANAYLPKRTFDQRQFLDVIARLL